VLSVLRLGVGVLSVLRLGVGVLSVLRLGVGVLSVLRLVIRLQNGKSWTKLIWLGTGKADGICDNKNKIWV
jgi:hypothetical protein